MENPNEESASSQPNQSLGSPSHETQPTSSYQQTQKRNCPESPPHGSHVPPQSPKRSKNSNPSPPSFPAILPLEIIAEILSILPVESLLRCRCVCRSWKSLISDPFFVKKHLKKTQNDPKFTRKRVLINTGSIQTEISIKSCSLNAIYQDPVLNPSTIEHPVMKDFHFDWIVGSCNGLICVAVRQDAVFLLNPTLRVFKRLPDLGFKKRMGCYTVYGFGFDASMDDYKVVSAFCYQSKISRDRYKSIVRVYSLRTNCWRRIQQFPLGVPCDDAGKYVDGKLNWAVFPRQELGSSWIIVSLDLAQETYKEVLQPDYGYGETENSLGILDGCLCVLCGYEGLYADVWVMREYGKRESWTKLVTVIPDLLPAFYSTTPLFISESGEILLHFGIKLILYNPKEKKFRIPVIQDDALSYIDQAEIYVESLVSPTVINQH